MLEKWYLHIFYGEHPLLVKRTQVSDPGPMGPLVLSPVTFGTQ